jgi:shikimate 5-dehydrogenase
MQPKLPFLMKCHAAQKWPQSLFGVETRAVGKDESQAATHNTEGLVNAARPCIGQDHGCAFPDSTIFNQQRVLDAVQMPANAGLIRIGREIGIYCISGFEMLLHTAVDSVAEITGTATDQKQEIRAIRVSQRPDACDQARFILCLDTQPAQAGDLKAGNVAPADFSLYTIFQSI